MAALQWRCHIIPLDTPVTGIDRAILRIDTQRKVIHDQYLVLSLPNDLINLGGPSTSSILDYTIEQSCGNLGSFPKCSPNYLVPLLVQLGLFILLTNFALRLPSIGHLHTILVGSLRRARYLIVFMKLFLPP